MHSAVTLLFVTSLYRCSCFGTLKPGRLLMWSWLLSQRGRTIEKRCRLLPKLISMWELESARSAPAQGTVTDWLRSPTSYGWSGAAGRFSVWPTTSLWPSSLLSSSAEHGLKWVDVFARCTHLLRLFQERRKKNQNKPWRNSLRCIIHRA